MRRKFLSLFLIIAGFSTNLLADDFNQIRAVLRLPESQIDIGKAKLIIDKMIDPGINIKSNLKKIDLMVSEILSELPTYASSADKLQKLRVYLYTANHWNKYQPYKYDFSDPYGKTIRNKLIPTYLATQKGNCVSMPILFIILGQRLGIDLTAAIAPEHILVKYREDTGSLINLEATSGANPARDVWIRQQNPMTDESIENGIYLRPLSKKETAALMLETLIEDYMQKRQYEKAIGASDLELEYFPQSVSAMLHKGAAYGRQVTEKYKSKYPSPNLIPPADRADFEYLDQNSRLWYAKAEALGWRMPSEIDEADYKQRVNNK